MIVVLSSSSASPPSHDRRPLFFSIPSLSWSSSSQFLQHPLPLMIVVLSSSSVSPSLYAYLWRFPPLAAVDGLAAMMLSYSTAFTSQAMRTIMHVSGDSQNRDYLCCGLGHYKNGHVGWRGLSQGWWGCDRGRIIQSWRDYDRGRIMHIIGTIALLFRSNQVIITKLVNSWGIFEV